MTPPVAVTHVGVTVMDLPSSIEWYGQTFGFELIAPPVEIRTDRGHAGALAGEVFGSQLGCFRQAHLASANGVGLELFEFVEPPSTRRRPAFEYWRTGISHLCVVCPDPDGTAERIARTGGKARMSKARPIFRGLPFLTRFCEDPSGNIIELYSHSYERTYATQARPVLT